MRFVGSTLILLALLCSAASKEIRLQQIEPVNGIVECKIQTRGWITNSMGPCADFTAPQAVAVGQTFSVAKTPHTIGVVTATQMEKDYPAMSIKRGEWYCAAAESMADLDSEGKQSQRIWLYIPKCVPVR